MATGYDVYVYIMYGHRAISCIGHRRRAIYKAVRRLYGDRAEFITGGHREILMTVLRGYPHTYAQFNTTRT